MPDPRLPRTVPSIRVPAILASLLLAGLAPGRADAADDGSPARLRVVALDREPKEGRAKPSEDALRALEAAVAEHPDDRGKRFDLVRGLIAGGDLPRALAAAKAWREKDAYNLVVIRLLGDIHAEMGDHPGARRAYSSVVELLPRDAEAARALATVEKQEGDLEGAYARLSSATRLKPDDTRMAFERADVAARLGKGDEATRAFEAIAGAKDAQESVRYPAKQRLGQLYAAERRAALGRGDRSAADRLGLAIEALALHGGTANDLKVYLSWDTDRSDVDLWMTSPSGEKVFYGHREGKGGEALFDDVTTGYGPESFTARSVQPGTYTVQVNYYGTRRPAFQEARGEVTVIAHEGTEKEARTVLPYRLFRVGQTVTVAKVEVKAP